MIAHVPVPLLTSTLLLKMYRPLSWSPLLPQLLFPPPRHTKQASGRKPCTISSLSSRSEVGQEHGVDCLSDCAARPLTAASIGLHCLKETRLMPKFVTCWPSHNSNCKTSYVVFWASDGHISNLSLSLIFELSLKHRPACGFSKQPLIF